MNVTVENLAPCKKLVRVEVEAPAVDTAFEEITKDFMKHAQDIRATGILLVITQLLEGTKWQTSLLLII